MGSVAQHAVARRQAGEQQHAAEGGERAHKHHHLKGDRQVGGPAIERATADVDRVVDGSRIILEPQGEGRAEKHGDHDHDV